MFTYISDVSPLSNFFSDISQMELSFISCITSIMCSLMALKYSNLRLIPGFCRMLSIAKLTQLIVALVIGPTSGTASGCIHNCNYLHQVFLAFRPSKNITSLV